MTRRLARILLLPLLPLLCAPALAGELGIGDRAPAIQVGSWVKGEPVGSFAAGHVYVVEFWATWCGPCRTSIPHLTKLQKELGDKATIIGVSVRERRPNVVEPFVEKMGSEMDYAVAVDKNDLMGRSWLDASGSQGIPTAFVVDGEGRIAWIGHPMQMDEPLKKIVAGEWDVEAAVKEKREREERRAEYEEAFDLLGRAFEDGEWKAAAAAADRLIALGPEFELYFGPRKIYALLQAGMDEEADAYAAKLIDGAARRSPRSLIEAAWVIADPDEDRKGGKRNLQIALRAAERANELTGETDAGALDTLAMVHFALGDVKKALSLQEKALEHASGGELRTEIESRLERYRKAAEERPA